VGATWTVANKSSPKKRAGRKKSPAPAPDPVPLAPWYVRNWSAGISIVAAIFAIGTYLHAAGWLTGPAKQSEMLILAEKVQQMEKRGLEADARIVQNLGDVATEVKEHRGVMTRLESLLSRLEGKLDSPQRHQGPVQ
jgi:hypothetical protein